MANNYTWLVGLTPGRELVSFPDYFLHVEGKSSLVSGLHVLLASFPGCSQLQFWEVWEKETPVLEGLGERVTCVTSVRCEGRREGGSAWQRILRWYFVQEHQTVAFERQRQYSLWFGRLKTRDSRLETDHLKVCELQQCSVLWIYPQTNNYSADTWATWT